MRVYFSAILSVLYNQAENATYFSGKEPKWNIVTDRRPFRETYLKKYHAEDLKVKEI